MEATDIVKNMDILELKGLELKLAFQLKNNEIDLIAFMNGSILINELIIQKQSSGKKKRIIYRNS